MRVDLTSGPAAFRGVDWSDLVLADPEGTVFHTPAYLKLWWEEFGSGVPVVARVMDEEGPVAACTFEVVEGTLRFLGGFDVTDYMGPVGRPGTQDEAAAELLRAVAEEVEWDRADLRGLPREGRWLGALSRAALDRGLEVRDGDDGVAPMIALEGTFEAYLAGLTPKLRHEIRRKERRLVEQAGPYRVTLSSAASIRADLDRFIGLHRASPGPKGRFMQPGMEIFFRRLGEALLGPHQFHLAFLEIGGRQAAGAIGFGFKDTFSLYNSAFDRDFGSLGPGMVLVAGLIRRAAEEGRIRFDMLKGDLDYKYRFGPVPRAVARLELARPVSSR